MRGNVALGHLASKLVSVLYYCLLRGELYDPARHWRDLGLAGDYLGAKATTPTAERPDV